MWLKDTIIVKERDHSVKTPKKKLPKMVALQPLQMADHQ